MHENAPTLKAEKRDRTGSRYARRLRESGKLPAVLYGHGEAPESLTLNTHETLLHIHKGEKVFQLDIDGNSQVVLLRDLQFGHLGDNIVHADFSRVNLTEKIHAHAHIRLVGEAPSLKNAGTVLMHPVTEITVECTVVNLPDEIEVDISELEEGGSIHAKDITLPEGVSLLSDGEDMLAHITHTVQAETAEESEVGGEAAPEVITEKKKEEG